MTGKFPIANAIKAGRVKPFREQGREMFSMSKLVRQLNNEAAFFDITVASQLYWTGKQDYYELDKDFGPMRPPFDVMWLEWEVPKTIIIGNQAIEREGVTHHGAILNSALTPVSGFVKGEHTGTRVGTPGRSGESMVLGMELFSFIYRESDDTAIFIPYGRLIGLVPETGLFSKHCLGLVSTTPMTAEQQKSSDELSEANVVWMALNLINCRNVTTKQIGSVFTRSGREKRQGVPVTRYHTIMLPGMSSRSHVKHSAQDRVTMAAHRVRGHFATYGPEAPLFGKHVGTFWVGWHVRGSKEHGEVIGDYKLGETG